MSCIEYGRICPYLFILVAQTHNWAPPSMSSVYKYKYKYVHKYLYGYFIFLHDQYIDSLSKLYRTLHRTTSVTFIFNCTSISLIIIACDVFIY